MTPENSGVCLNRRTENLCKELLVYRSVLIIGISIAGSEPIIQVLSNPMEHNLWGVNSRTDSKEIPCLLCISNFYFCIHINPPLDLLPGPLNPVHILFLKTNLNISIPSTFKSTKLSLPLRFLRLNCCMHLSHTPCALHAPLISI
jgi:hypothetical protein